MDRQRITRIQEIAIEDAAVSGLDTTRTFIFIVPGQSPPNQRLATFFRPGRQVFAASDFPAAQNQVAEANSADAKAGFRIGIFYDYPDLALIGLLRHELEHALQWQCHGEQMFELFDLYERVLIHNFGGQPGSALHYNKIPMEYDANAAGSLLVKKIGSPDEIEALQNDSRFSQLGREYTRAQGSLPRRMRSFLDEYADAFENWSQQQYETDSRGYFRARFPEH